MQPFAKLVKARPRGPTIDLQKERTKMPLLGSLGGKRRWKIVKYRRKNRTNRSSENKDSDPADEKVRVTVAAEQARRKKS